VFSDGRIAMDGAPDEVFSRADELIEMGLDVPAPTAIARALRERGMALPGGIYTSDELLRAVESALGGGAGVC